MAVLVLLAALSVAIGTREVGLDDIAAALRGQVDTIEQAAVAARIPRTVLAALAGASLGMAGAIMQGVTRNPLADPGILGVNAGASFAVVLGIAFTCLQAYEYSHAAFGLADTAYGGVFFLATGLHGFHVIIGTIFLAVCAIRFSRGQMTQDNHVGFEAAAWYWHFVDVVWLFLFAAIYIWGR